MQLLTSSLSYMNEYLAIDSGVYLYEQPSRFNCSMAGWVPEKLRRCLIEQVCQGREMYRALSSPQDWIFRYMGTYFFTNFYYKFALIHTVCLNLNGSFTKPIILAFITTHETDTFKA